MKKVTVVVAFAALAAVQLLAADPDSAVDARLRTAAQNPQKSVVSGADPFTCWKWSLVPFAASQVLDASSSWGLRELNPVLAESNHQFGAGSASVKLGAAAAFIGVEYLIVKKFPRSARVFSKLNWTAAGATTGLAAYNFTLR